MGLTLPARPAHRLIRNARADQPIQHRKLSIEEVVALLKELRLSARPHSAARALAISRIEFLDDLHSLDDFPERCKSGPVLLRHVAGCDKDLRRASVWRDHGEGERPTGI